MNTAGLIPAILPLVLVICFGMLKVHRRKRIIQKTTGWETVTGTVLRVRAIIIGDGSTPVVDVKYDFSGRTFYKNDVFTGAYATGEFPPGTSIDMLIDPANPVDCLAKQYVAEIIN